MSDPVRRVLVVDADATTADAVRDALPSSGFEVVPAGDAAGALGAVREGRIDLVMSELLLPDDSGLHLLVETRLRFPLVPRMVVTALQDFKSAVTAINEAEVFRFLPKPLDAATVRAAVDEALGRADTLHEARGVQEKAERRRLALHDLETDFPGITLVSHGPEGYFIPPQRLRSVAERLKGTPIGEALAASITSAPSHPSST
jgi:DNA-binding NtrC family response regulator